MIGATALAFPVGAPEGDVMGQGGLSLGGSAIIASDPSDGLVLSSDSLATTLIRNQSTYQIQIQVSTKIIYFASSHNAA